MGEQFVPFERVGVYVPGGAAPLASTALMTATLAQVAGVKEIVACTPSDAEGSVNPVLLYALKVAGATEVYRIGGIQAVGLMAYGCGSVKKVQKIVGPGGAYVTAAKRQVYGDVALDLVAGPSEIAVLADETANPEHVAMDLFSQLEHGTGHEKALLVATSQEIAETVADAMLRIGPGLSRWGFLKGVLSGGLMLAVVEDEEAGIDLVNRFAPEHLELLVARPRRVLKKITCAGAIFMGPWTPESVGDFVAGPSHVLPTGGAAAMFSGLTVDDFRRRSSFVDFTRADLMEALPVIEAFGDFGFGGGNIEAAKEAYESIRIQQHEPAPGEMHKPPVPAAQSHSIIDENTGAPPAIHTGQWANHPRFCAVGRQFGRRGLRENTAITRRATRRVKHAQLSFPLGQRP